MASISSCGGAATGASSDHSSAAVSPIVINNIVDLIPIKLDGTNYLMWRSLFESILRGQNLMQHIDGSVPSPCRGSYGMLLIRLFSLGSMPHFLSLLFPVPLVRHLLKKLGISLPSALATSHLLMFFLFGSNCIILRKDPSL